MTRPAIVGSGLIGRAWAISFARSAHQVVLWDEYSAASRKALDFICGARLSLPTNFSTTSTPARSSPLCG